MAESGVRISESSKRIPSLDGWRAFSIVLVLVGHVLKTGGISVSIESQRIGAGFATIGVKIFFVISGYIITKLLIQELANKGRIELRDFYLRRSIRILPPLFFVVMATFVFNWFVVDLGLSFQHLLAAFTFTIPVLPWNQGNWAVGHLWSLSVEEHFYLIWPFVIAGFGVQRAFQVGLAFIVLAPIINVLIFLSGYQVFLSTFPACGDVMMWGCLTAIWESRPSFTMVKELDRFLAYIQCFALLGLCVIAWLTTQLGAGRFLIPFANSSIGVLVSFLILSTIHHQTGILFSLLNWSWVQKIGVLSYALYLTQQFFLYPSQYALGWWNTFPVNILMAVLLAIVLHVYVEKPCSRWKKRFSSQASLA